MCRRWNAKVAEINNETYTTSADYTVQVSKLPLGIKKKDMEEELRKFFDARLNYHPKLQGTEYKEKDKIHSVVVPTESSGDFARASVEYAETWRDLVEATVRKSKGNAGCCPSWVPCIGKLDDEKLEKKLKEKETELKNTHADMGDENSCGIAFVTFKKAKYAHSAKGRYQTQAEMLVSNAVSSRFVRRGKPPKIHGIVPQVTRASEATDVNWENLSYQMKFRGYYPFVMQWLTNAAVLLLVPIFSVVYTLTHYKFELAGKIDAPSSESLRWYEVVIRGLLENLLTYADWSAEKLQRETGLVEDAFADKLKVTSVSLVVTIFISLTSFVVRELLYFLERFERSATATDAQMRLFTLGTLVYVAQYLNIFRVYSELSFVDLKEVTAAGHTDNATFSTVGAV